MTELQELGVARVSLGGSLARSAYGALVRAAKEVLLDGTFHFANDAISSREINNIFDLKDV
jgi:2-methylisocitrate lyase-like PEP mutase family enzyme